MFSFNEDTVRIAEAFGLRFGLGVRIWPTDERVNAWSASGVAFDVVALLCLLLQRRLLLNASSVRIAKAAHIINLQAVVRGMCFTANRGVMAQRRREFEAFKVDQVKRILRNIQEQSQDGHNALRADAETAKHFAANFSQFERALNPTTDSDVDNASVAVRAHGELAPGNSDHLDESADAASQQRDRAVSAFLRQGGGGASEFHPRGRSFSLEAVNRPSRGLSSYRARLGGDGEAVRAGEEEGGPGTLSRSMPASLHLGHDTETTETADGTEAMPGTSAFSAAAGGITREEDKADSESGTAESGSANSKPSDANADANTNADSNADSNADANAGTNADGNDADADNDNAEKEAAPSKCQKIGKGYVNGVQENLGVSFANEWYCEVVRFKTMIQAIACERGT